MRATLVALSVAVAIVAAGCRRSPEVQPGRNVALDSTDVECVLPELPVYELAPGADTVGMVRAQRGSRDPLAGASQKRVTITTDNADVRTLLLWLAQQAEVNLVVSPDVRSRVSVALRDVPAVDALRAVMAEAGLSVLVSGLQAPWPPVVFYQLPVNINSATAEAIAARFGVSLEMARFIVESRVQP